VGFLKKEIKSSTAWIIVAAAVVLLFGGALSWAYYNEPNDYDYSNGGTLARQKTEVDETADWKTYTNDTYGYSGKYPKDWTFDDKTNASSKIAIIYSPTVAAQKKEIQDKNLAVGGPIAEVTIYYYQSAKDLDGSTQKKYSTLSDAVNDSNFVSSVKETILDGVKAFEGIQSGMYNSYTVLAENNSHIYQIAFNNIDNKDQLTTTLKNILATFKFASITATSVSSTAATAAWKSYQNTDYGFGLTFTDAWEGYKMKAVDLEGTVKTFYVNIPTTDSNYATETSMSYAGYTAPFAISVINKSEWQDDEIFARDFGSKVGEKGDYVFTSSSWQACPTDLCDGGITSSLKTVMDSFEIL